MSLKVSAPDGVKVYNISSSKAVPQWISDAKKKSIRKSEEFRRRLELLQDFRFPAACQRIKVSPDGQYVFASGYHPPQVKVYDLSQLSLKFDRHLDSEIVDFQILSEDYSKAVFLCADRSLCFHARFGTYHKTRVPRFGRDLAYCPFTAEVVVGGSAPELWRLSLEEGRFMSPLSTKAPATNALGLSSVHGLLAAACEEGWLECFDPRARQSVGLLDVGTSCGAAGQDLTSVRFDDTGLHVAVGTKNGLVALYDLRSQRPLVVKDHMYGSPIIDIKFHTSPGDAGGSSKRVISSDRHIIKIWDVSNGNGYTSIEPTEGDINDVVLWPQSGLVIVACDSPVVPGYFIPSLGPAPRFVTKDDLLRLGLDHLIGTAMLRAYMHGFFVDNRLYNKAKSLTQPFAYEQYKQQRVQQKLEEERKSRISVVKRLPKVNAAVAAKLLAQDAAAAAAAAGDAQAQQTLRKKGLIDSEGKTTVLNPMADDRFKAMFEDADFQVDETADEYKLLHPNAEDRNRRKREDQELIREHFEQLSDDDDDQGSPSGSDQDVSDASASVSGSDNDDNDDALFATGRQRDSDSDENRRSSKRGGKHRQQNKGKGSYGGGVKGVAKGGVEKRKGGASVSMYAARDPAAVAAFQRRESRGAGVDQTLAERVAAQAAAGAAAPVRRVGGSRELTFVPKGGSGGRGRGGGRGGGGRGRGGGGRGRGRR